MKKSETSKEEKEKLGKEISLEILGTLLYPLVSEKAVDKIEKENKLTFIVAKNASKKDVKEAVEKEFNVKVSKVNIINDTKGRKKAIVAIDKAYKASDIAMKLGIL